MRLTKADLETHIHPEILDEVTRSDDTVINRAIKAGEGEAKAYLNRYDIATIFDAESGFEDDFFLSLLKDLSCWHLIKLANPNINLELFRTSYEDARKTLKDVMMGYIDPAWPLRADDPATSIDDAGNIEWTSNTKRNNHY